MAKYRGKETVDAVRVAEDTIDEVKVLLDGMEVTVHHNSLLVVIDTGRCTLEAEEGDWIVVDSMRNVYVCGNHVFSLIYEAME